MTQELLARAQAGDGDAFARLVESHRRELHVHCYRLTMHPATLGQSIDRLATRELVTTDCDPRDRRRRIVAVTAAGRALLAGIPLVGPVRLRTQDADPDRLARLATAFDDAVDLFGLEEWT